MRGSLWRALSGRVAEISEMQCDNICSFFTFRFQRSSRCQKLLCSGVQAFTHCLLSAKPYNALQRRFGLPVFATQTILCCTSSEHQMRFNHLVAAVLSNSDEFVQFLYIPFVHRIGLNSWSVRRSDSQFSKNCRVLQRTCRLSRSEKGKHARRRAGSG